VAVVDVGRRAVVVVDGTAVVVGKAKATGAPAAGITRRWANRPADNGEGAEATPAATDEEGRPSRRAETTTIAPARLSATASESRLINGLWRSDLTAPPAGRMPDSGEQ
jgi:hypothetical protein